MASGATLVVFTPLHNEPTAATPATLDVRNAHPVLDFDAAADEFAVFGGIMPRNYGAGGITVYIHWLATTAVTGDVVWNVAWERIGEGQQDLDSDGFAAVQAVTATAPGTSGFVDIAAVTFTNGAQMDSVAVGEGYRLKVSRDADNGSDTMAGDAELRFVELKET